MTTKITSLTGHQVKAIRDHVLLVSDGNLTATTFEPDNVAHAFGATLGAIDQLSDLRRNARDQRLRSELLGSITALHSVKRKLFKILTTA